MPTNMKVVQLSNQLEQLQGEVKARLSRATPEGETEPNAELFAATSTDVDMTLGAYLQAKHKEYKGLQAELDDYRMADEEYKGLSHLFDSGKEIVNKAPIAMGPTHQRFSSAILESEQWKDFRNGNIRAKDMAFDVDLELKALFETTTASNNNDVSVESIRTGDFVPQGLTEVTLLDIIPQIPTTDPVVKYDEEVKNESNAAAIAQGAVYLESAFQYDEKSVNVSKMGTYINVSEEALDDVAELRARLDGSLRGQLARRIQSDIIGAAPRPASEYVGTPTDNTNISGFLEHDSVQSLDTHPLVSSGETYNHFNAISDAEELVKRVGFARADALVMNSQDWKKLRQLQSTTGSFVIRGALAPLTGAVTMALDGMPIIECNALPVGSVLVGAFREHAVIRDRQSVQVRMQEAQSVVVDGTAETVFTQPSGRYNIFADARLAFYMRRPEAFVKILNFGVTKP